MTPHDGSNDGLQHVLAAKCGKLSLNYPFYSFLPGALLISTAVVVLLFYVHGKHLRSCRDGQLTLPHFSWAGLDLLGG